MQVRLFTWGCFAFIIDSAVFHVEFFVTCTLKRDVPAQTILPFDV